MSDENKSIQIRAKSRTYFVDIEKTKNGVNYLKITESRYMGENEERERKSIIVFPEFVAELSNAISELSSKLTQ